MRQAQSTAEKTVEILFADQEISALFSQLLRAHGAQTKILQSSETLNEGAYLITESCFLDVASTRSVRGCLVVGDSAPEGTKSEWHVLTQPLTEHKVETALSNFLERVNSQPVAE